MIFSVGGCVNCDDGCLPCGDSESSRYYSRSNPSDLLFPCPRPLCSPVHYYCHSMVRLVVSSVNRHIFPGFRFPHSLSLPSSLSQRRYPYPVLLHLSVHQLLHSR